MIQIKNTIVSLDVLKEKFHCDLAACKGECCVQGDAGAPLTEEEPGVLHKIYPAVKPYMRPEAIKAAEKRGLYEKDDEGEYVTALVEGKECIFTVFDERGIARCAIEQAWKDGKISFRKPLSCHLYPVRLKEYRDFTAVQYHRWDICNPGRALGEKLDMPLYKFLREPLIRRFGPEWYRELEEVAEAYLSQQK